MNTLFPTNTAKEELERLDLLDALGDNLQALPPLPDLSFDFTLRSPSPKKSLNKHSTSTPLPASHPDSDHSADQSSIQRIDYASGSGTDNSIPSQSNHLHEPDSTLEHDPSHLDILQELADASAYRTSPVAPTVPNNHQFDTATPPAQAVVRVRGTPSPLTAPTSSSASRRKALFSKQSGPSSAGTTPPLPPPPSDDVLHDKSALHGVSLRADASGLASSFPPLRVGEETHLLSAEMGRHASPRSTHSHSEIFDSPSRQLSLQSVAKEVSFEQQSLSTPTLHVAAERKKATPVTGVRSVLKAKATTLRPRDQSSSSSSLESFAGSSKPSSAQRQVLTSMVGQLRGENLSLLKSFETSHGEIKRLRQENKRLKMSALAEEDSTRSEAETEESTDVSLQIEDLLRNRSNFSAKLHISGAGQESKDMEGNSTLQHGAQEDQIVALESRVYKMSSRIKSQDQELVLLRQQLLDTQSFAESRSTPQEKAQLLQIDNFKLQDELRRANEEIEQREDANEMLREEMVLIARRTADLNTTHEDLRLELDYRQAEIARLQAALDEEVQNFNHTHAVLEAELRVGSDEKEEGLLRIKMDIEKERKELQMLRGESHGLEELKALVLELEEELDKLTEERDTLAGQVDEGDREFDEKMSELEGIIAQKEQEIERLTNDLGVHETAMEEIDGEMEVATSKLDEVEALLKDAEEARDAALQQTTSKEEEADRLRAALAQEKNVVTSLSAQISSLSMHKTKAKSPLANELFSSSTRDSTVVALEEELEEAQRQITTLNARLVKAERESVKDVRIQTLEVSNVELGKRVKTLSEQVSFEGSPRKSGDESLLFKTIPTFATPKTPGFFAKNISSWSPIGNDSADGTISPLLSQIHESEQAIERLQAQLAAANSQLDSNLDHLEAAGDGAVSLARQLAAARERIAQLEAELDALVGVGGFMSRVRSRLERVGCTACGETFDANEVVGMRFDEQARTARLVSPASSPQALHSVIAGVTSKLAGLGSDDKTLAAEKETIARQHRALQLEFDRATRELAGLQGERERETKRVAVLLQAKATSDQELAALQARFDGTHTELETVKSKLARTASPDVVVQLEQEKADLVEERADVMARMRDAEVRESSASEELAAARLAQATMDQHLNREIASLKASLANETARHGVFVQEIKLLQAGLDRSREEGLRFRDVINQKGGDDAAAELLRRERDTATGTVERLRRQLESSQKRAEQHSCLEFTSAVKVKHRAELNGMMVRILYLKHAVTREAGLRYEAAWQKSYYRFGLRQKEKAINMIHDAMGLRSDNPEPPRRMSLKNAVHMVIATNRLMRFSREQNDAKAGNERLRAVLYPAVRGHPFRA